MSSISIRRLAIRLFIPISWRISRQRIAKSLRRFSEVEADSAWQMLAALDGVADPEFRAQLFNNALEEVHHSYIFRNLARKYEEQLISPSPQERRRLFDPRQGLVMFEAYRFVGESDVYRDFLAYAEAAPYQDIRDTFIAIRGDEEEHQKLAYAKLDRLCGSTTATRRLILKVRLRRAWDSWIRASKKIGDFFFSLILLAIYFTLGMLSAPFCKARLRADPAFQHRQIPADEEESPEPAIS
jgi:rubrerythrin